VTYDYDGTWLTGVILMANPATGKVLASQDGSRSRQYTYPATSVRPAP
jgi:hypothetical protein